MSDRSSRDRAFLTLTATCRERAERLRARHPRLSSSKAALAESTPDLETQLIDEIASLDGGPGASEHCSRLEYFLRRRRLKPTSLALARRQRLPAPLGRLAELAGDRRADVLEECGLTMIAQLALVSPPERRIDLLQPLGTGWARQVADRFDGEAARMILLEIPRDVPHGFRRAYDALREHVTRDDLVHGMGRVLFDGAMADLDPTDRAGLSVVLASLPASEKVDPVVPESARAPLLREIILGILETTA